MAMLLPPVDSPDLNPTIPEKVYLGGYFFEIQKKRHFVYGGEAIFLTQIPNSWFDPKSTFFSKKDDFWGKKHVL